jgi:predicted phage terminase large subunit-like protein
MLFESPVIERPQITLRRPVARSGPKRRGLSFPDWFRRTLPPMWSVPPHLQFVLECVQDVVAGRTTRLAISLPPGHAKSSTITHRLPVYWGERHAGDAVVFTGYSQRFAEKHLSQPAREIARERGLLSPDATALDEWSLTNGARLVARGVGNPPTGVNPISLLVVDDPIKSRDEAASPVVRENVWEWWTGSIVQRFWPRTRAIIIATRWHEADLIGRLKEQGGDGWTFINLPALAVEDDPLGREPGEALWPEAKPAAFLHGLRQEMGAYEFEAVFQGNPTPREGSVFKVSELRYVDASELPRDLKRCRAWDLAATEGAGDYTAGVLIGRGGDGLTYVLDVTRGQWDASLRNRRMMEAAERDGTSVRVRLPQDPGQAGREQAQQLTRMFAGYAVRTAPVTGDKETRADPFAAQVNAGNVRILRAAWNAAFVEELRAFPAGRNDDMVDAAADGFNELTRPTEVRRAPPRVDAPYAYREG